MDSIKLQKLRELRALKVRHRAAQREHARARFATPGELAAAIDPTTVQTPALDVVDAAMVDVAEGRCDRLIISLPPQEGKSTRVTKTTPLWMLLRNPELRIAIASYGQDLAEEFGQAIRDFITANSGDEGTLDLGLRIAPDNGAARRWRIDGHRGGVRSVGLASGLTGRPADLLLVDDPIKGKEDADSQVWRNRVWNWWLTVGSTRLAPGAPVIVILCMAGDTPVLLADGTERPLRDVRPGDEVATYEGGRIATSTVVNWANQGPDDLFRIRMKSGRVVRANARHPFLTIDANGKESWLRTDQIRPGVRILTATGGSGGASPAPSMNATCQRGARECVTPTTTRHVGHPATVRRRSMSRRVAEPDSSIVTASPTTRLTSSSTSRAETAPSAGSHRPTATPGPIGTGSSASTTTTTPGKCADCSATIATSPSDTGSHPPSSELPRTIWSVTPDEVVAVDPCGREDVFDLQIAGTENFIANGLVSHNTRWHEDDLAGRLLAAEDGHRWREINIPAQADYDPAKGESDPLGRTPGEYLTSARGRTVEEWEQIKVEKGSRTWNALYQGRPSPGEGSVFKRGWWQWYDTPRAIQTADGTWKALGIDTVIASWDMAFKDTDGSDFVVGQIWGRKGADAFLLDQIHGRFDFTATCREVELLHYKWPQAAAILVEDKANGPAVLSQLRHRVPGLIPVTPTDSKLARAHAVSPFVEAGNVHLPSASLAPWISDWLEEVSAFPLAAHDDRVDAMTQALHRLLIANTGTADEFMAQLAAARGVR